jgi:hypothetical protein
MRTIFPSSARAAVSWLLVVALLAPAALGASTTDDPSLWAEFIAWVQAGLGVPDGITLDEAGYVVWLMVRPTIPGG